MTKVLHLSKGYPPRVGGIESATQSFARVSSDFGYDTEVLCYGDTASSKCVRGIQVNEVRSLLNIKGQPISVIFIILGLVKGLRSDIIHGHIPDYNTLIIVILISFLSPKKKILIHWHSDILGKGILHRILLQIEILAIKRCSNVIFGSPDYLNSSYVKNHCQEKSVIIEYPSTKFQKNRTFLPTRKSNIIRLISVGRLVQYKGFLELITAMIDQPKLDLTIIGSGPLKKDIQKLICKYDLNDRVRLFENLSDNAIYEHYCKADLFILNSQNRAESYGIVLVEALSSGLPILTRIVQGSGMNYINNNKSYGRVYHSTSQVQTLAQHVLRDGVKRKEVVEYAINRFGYDAFFDKAKKLYGG